jgi:hypothetical protein
MKLSARSADGIRTLPHGVRRNRFFGGIMESSLLGYPTKSRIDYCAILSPLLAGPTESIVSSLAADLPYMWLDAYLALMPRPTNIVQFKFDAFIHIYDDCASLGKL